MKFSPDVIAALQTLKNAADNDFELHRISVLEKDLTAPPVVEVIDDTRQKFDGVTYHSDKNGQYIYTNKLHKAVYQYYQGEIPEGLVVHHKDWNKDNNDVSNLVLLTPSEHSIIHKQEPPEDSPNLFHRKCIVCDNPFITANSRRNVCSHSCAMKLNHANKRKNIENKMRICKRCGKSFPALESKNGCFCSYACSSYYNRQQKINAAAPVSTPPVDVPPSDSPTVSNY